MNAKWTFMVYMAGDNSLSEAGEEDLKEMRQVGSSPDVNIVAQFDNAGDQGTRRFHIKRGGVNDVVEDMTETDSGDPLVLMDFIKWCANSYPADRYALVLWNHGGGWEPGDLDRFARSERIKNYNIREASFLSASRLKRSFFATTVKKILNEPTPHAREICVDDGTGNSLDTIELGNVLKYAKDNLGQKLDILGMDACLMSNFEVAYQTEPYVKYIVSSEETEPGQGWPYVAILDKLVNSPDLSTADLSCEIVKDYIKSYQELGQKDVTQSAYDLSRVKDAAKSLNELALVLMNNMGKEKSAILEAQYNSMSFDDYKLYDINHFSKELLNLTSNDDVKNVAQNVVKAFEQNPGNFVIADSHLGAFYSQCCGASIYMIPPPRPVSIHYAKLEFAKDNNNWPGMLEKMREKRKSPK